MKRIPIRLRILAIALLLVVVIATVDRLTSGHPAAASAAPGQPNPIANSGVAGARQTPAALLRRLTKSVYPSVSEEIERMDRDLFQPTVVVEEAVLAAEAATPPTSAPAGTTDKADEDAEFRQKHRLTGVVLGPTPLAVIDERVITMSGVVEGYVLIEVQRDQVVFRSPVQGGRVVLEVQRRPNTH